MNIIARGVALMEATSRFAEHARRFFYEVMLSSHPCPRCGRTLVMVTEGQCRCSRCEHRFEPTVSLQRCDDCGGKLMLRVRRYVCRNCGRDVQSRFLFDGLVFDAEYFRQKVSEHRERQKERRERIRLMLAENRSMPVGLDAADLDSVPGLTAALDGLTSGMNIAEHALLPKFDLQRYEQHVRAHVNGEPLCFDAIPPLVNDRRRDRIWRFIALIFLAHARLVEVWQEGNAIWVIKCETDSERQDLSGGTEATDGCEGPVGRIEAG